MAFGFDPSGTHRATKKKQRIFVVVLGTSVLALLGVGTMLALNSQIGEASQRPQSDIRANDPFGTVTLVTVNSKVQKGVKLTASYLRETYWPRDQVPEGAIKSLQDVVDKFATVQLSEGSPILTSNISMTQPTFNIAELLPPGHRAITIQVNSTTGLEGWATPGQHVDVILTFPEQDLSAGKMITKSLVAVANAVVLSFDGKTTSPDATGDADRAGMDTATITLAVPLADSLKIQNANSIGKITLALRNPNDPVISGETSITSEIFGGKQKPSALKPQQNSVIGSAKIDGREMKLMPDGRWREEKEGEFN